MEPAPIRSGAIRPRGRRRHALHLVRLVAIAGFALAGWMALAALTDSASASELPDTPHKIASQTDPRPATAAAPAPAKPRPAGTEPTDTGPTGPAATWPAGIGSADGPPVFDGAPKGFGDRPMRDVEAWGRELPERVQKVGDRPVEFLQGRRHEVFDRKDRAVRHVRKLADAAGVPRVRIGDVRDVRPDTPIVGGLVREIAGTQAVPGENPPAEAQQEQRQSPADDDGHASGEVADGAAPAPGAQAPSASDTEDEAPGRCPGCQGDQRAPGPVAPSGQDNPRGSGGHVYVPIADLRDGLYAAAPAAAEASRFHRTALTDVSAPGGPSVVPD